MPTQVTAVALGCASPQWIALDHCTPTALLQPSAGGGPEVLALDRGAGHLEVTEATALPHHLIGDALACAISGPLGLLLGRDLLLHVIRFGGGGPRLARSFAAFPAPVGPDLQGALDLRGSDGAVVAAVGGRVGVASVEHLLEVTDHADCWRFLPVPRAHAAAPVILACIGGSCVGVAHANNAVCVYELDTGALRFDAGLVCNAAAVSALHLDTAAGLLLVGQSDGTLRGFSTDPAACGRPLLALDLARRCFGPSVLLGPASGAQCSVLSIAAWGPRSVIVLTAVGVAEMDLHSHDSTAEYFFDALASSGAVAAGGLLFVDSAFTSSCAFYDCGSPGTPPSSPPPAPRVASSALTANGALVEFAQHSDSDSDAAESDEGRDVDRPTGPPKLQSSGSCVPAVAEAVWPEEWMATLGLDAPTTKSSSAQPVTFGRPIKSSGYVGATPWSVQQAQKAKARKAQSQLQRKPQVKAVPNYNTACSMPCRPLPKSNAAADSLKIHRSCITAVAFDPAGDVLLTASNDGTAHELRLPVAAAKPPGDGCLRGHTQAVLDADHGAATRTIATASTDGTVCVWRPGLRAGALLTHKVGRDVRAVRFVAKDRLLVFPDAGTLTVVRYALDTHKDDLDRQRNLSRVAAVASSATGAQAVTALDTVNWCSTSAAVAYAASNKEVAVWDAASQQAVVQFQDAHARSVHSVVCLGASARYADAGLEPLHCLLSAGLDSAVRLWDVRSKRAVRTFAAHKNAAVPVGVSASPCGRFLAVGSEDRAVYWYDVSNGAVLAKESCPDVPSALRFHPTQPHLVAGTQSGQLRFFTGQ